MCRLGFKRFICNLEGIPFTPLVVKRATTSLLNIDFDLPDDYHCDNTLDLIRDVINAGIDGYLEDPETVDRAFSWNTHSMEDEWAELFDGGPVTQRIFEVCLAWDAYFNEDVTDWD